MGNVGEHPGGGGGLEPGGRREEQIRSSGTGGLPSDPVVRIPEFHYHGLGSIPGRELRFSLRRRSSETAGNRGTVANTGMGSSYVS